MKRKDQFRLTLNENSCAILEKSGETFNRAVNKIIHRYEKIVSQCMPKLSDAEWGVLQTALTREDGSVVPFESFKPCLLASAREQSAAHTHDPIIKIMKKTLLEHVAYFKAPEAIAVIEQVERRCIEQMRQKQEKEGKEK